MTHDALCPVAIRSKNVSGQATVLTYASGTCQCSLIDMVRASTLTSKASDSKACQELYLGSES